MLVTDEDTLPTLKKLSLAQLGVKEEHYTNEWLLYATSYKTKSLNETYAQQCGKPQCHLN